MRSFLVLAAALFVALARAQDLGDITPLVTNADEITPLVTNADEITPLLPTTTSAAAATTTLCSSATATVTAGVYGVNIDPYNPPEGWQCIITWPQGGGVWRAPIAPTQAPKDNRIVKIVVPIVVAVAAALAFLGIGLYAVRRRAQRAHETAATRPWFKHQGWVSSKANVAGVEPPVPAMVQTNVV